MSQQRSRGALERENAAESERSGGSQRCPVRNKASNSTDEPATGNDEKREAEASEDIHSENADAQSRQHRSALSAQDGSGPDGKRIEYKAVAGIRNQRVP